ncbi:Fe(2+) transport protein A [BD1-7 clade bacterium]|uniref:Fe(2+) transport protein A n=1 Tax=BD1-7 clade bacterium TaxID=2029982 RepID=A0A5S9QXK0_9GAMM|nr:Fe(2+) transport protein A [BD1-7 clade bacterium]
MVLGSISTYLRWGLTLVIPFSELKLGDSATISRCDVKAGSVIQRLMTLGLTPGTPLSVTRVAPLGDPIEIAVRDFKLSLRRQEAAGIWVEKPSN